MKFNYYSLLLIAIFIMFNNTDVFSQNDQNFTIILDAGHGGKDPGKFVMVILKRHCT
jgi:N-acetylmuramoyl-L-alanine amidase